MWSLKKNSFPSKSWKTWLFLTTTFRRTNLKSNFPYFASETIYYILNFEEEMNTSNNHPITDTQITVAETCSWSELTSCLYFKEIIKILEFFGATGL